MTGSHSGSSCCERGAVSDGTAGAIAGPGPGVYVHAGGACAGAGDIDLSFGTGGVRSSAGDNEE